MCYTQAMNNTVRAENYQTCICGRVCKGKLALVNHGRKCDMEIARSRAFIILGQQGKQLTDDTFRRVWSSMTDEQRKQATS